MISMQEILQSHSTYDKLSAECKQNIKVLLERINEIRKLYGRPMIVNSGYRPPEYNAKIGGAKNSWHTKCAAIDIKDNLKKSDSFGQWCLTHVKDLENAGLWLEDFDATHDLQTGKGWVHLQIFPPKSGHRFFKP